MFVHTAQQGNYVLIHEKGEEKVPGRQPFLKDEVSK